MIPLAFLALPVSFVASFFLSTKYARYSKFFIQALLVFLCFFPVVYTYDLSNNYLPFFAGKFPTLTAEPLYKNLVQALPSFGFDQHEILFIHVVCSLLLVNLAFSRLNSLNIVPERFLYVYEYCFWLLPGITVCYLSPRSGISLALIFYGLSHSLSIALDPSQYPSAKRLLTLGFYFSICIFGCLLHYQYIVIFAMLSLLLFFLSLNIPFFNYSMIRFPRCLLIFLGVPLYGFVLLLKSGIVLDYVQAGVDIDYAQRKLSRLSDDAGFRLTSLVTVGCFIYLSFRGARLFSGPRRSMAYLLILFTSLVSMIVVIAFWGSPHFAGRLARLGDYIVLPFVLSSLIYSSSRGWLTVGLAFFASVFASFLYPTAFFYVG